MSKSIILSIDFKNCYGIKSLKKDFQFSDQHSTFSLYASNGSMKTSFAKTFEDISKKRQPKDLIFPEKKTTCEIQFDGQDIKPSQIFVIHSYNKDYSSEKLSTLLVNKELRKKYDNIYKEINNKKNIFLKGLINICKIKDSKEIEELISKIFYNKEINKFFPALERIKEEINSDSIDNYKDIKYKDIFEEKIKIFLNNSEVKKNIEQYINKYDELLDNSTYFKKGIFNHSQAEDTAKQLKKNGFFEAKHSVLFGGKKISTEKELTEVINQEKNQILENEQLKKIFDELDNKITKNESLKKFRQFLSDNNFIIAKLNNLESLEANLWKYYIKENKNDFTNLLEEYSKGKTDIIEISTQAKEEKTIWSKTIDIFNERFIVPFTVTVSNDVEVMLHKAIPSIAFEFLENKKKKNIKKESLLDVLSQGEKRALYILDIIYEIEARKNENENHLFIIDDIADSFDYQNKYAIIEYLQDISQITNFYQIVLSHNFDFHRTISSRLLINRENRLNVIKSQDKSVELKEEHYQYNPFTKWKKELNNKYYLIASIPLVRNLAQYIGEKDLDTLTQFIHIKNKTKNLTIQNLKTEFEKILKINCDKITSNDNFLEFLKKATDEIPKITDRQLEHKIVLAISIRVEAEQFILEQCKNIDLPIKKNQTAELIKYYKKDFKNNIENIKILDKVQLMTPETIHLNSFMFEPLLDMSDEYLIELYNKISQLKKYTHNRYFKFNH